MSLSLILLLVSVPLADEPARPTAESLLAGYSNYEALTNRITQLDNRPSVAVASLGKSGAGRDLWLLTIGDGEVDRKPAMLIVGNTDATHLLGGEAVLGLADALSAESGPAADWRKQVTFYLIPRPNPDGSEALFARPLHAFDGNLRPSDDDQDFRTDEDPPNDLNSDGLITQMRVADPAGDYLPHPEEPRLLVKADPSKGEVGKYRLYTEGRDDDGDEQQSEDGVGGVAVDRNLTFAYPHFTPGAGLHAVSEPETRALVDFAYDHGNVAAMLTFSPVDNLMHPWKPNPGANKGRIINSVHADDAAILQRFAERFQKLGPDKGAPAAGKWDGSVVGWGYFHYGRWSLGSRGWWIPPAAEKAKPAESKPAEAGAAKAAPGEAAADKAAETKPEAEKAAVERAAENAADQPPGNSATKAEDKPEAKPKEVKPDNRAEAERRALAWFDEVKRPGFVPWTAIEHPDFPGRTVEVGGFAPLAMLNPPADQIPAVVERHLQWVGEYVQQRPRLEVVEVKVADNGGGVFRIDATVRNIGQLPTLPHLGRQTTWTYPLRVDLQLAGKVTYLSGSPRGRLEPLAPGATAERTWLVLVEPAASDAPAKLEGKLTVSAPAVGRAEKAVTSK